MRNGFANCPMGQGHGQVRTHFTSSGLPLLPTPVKGDKKAIHHSPEEAAVQRVLESVGELASPSWSAGNTQRYLPVNVSTSYREVSERLQTFS